jgi:hypothetical protein
MFSQNQLRFKTKKNFKGGSANECSKDVSSIRRRHLYSALGIICGELENKGYTVTINGTSVTSEGFYNDIYKEISTQTEPLNVALLKDGIFEQQFTIQFIDFHEFIIRK